MSIVAAAGAANAVAAATTATTTTSTNRCVLHQNVFDLLPEFSRLSNRQRIALIDYCAEFVPRRHLVYALLRELYEDMNRRSTANPKHRKVYKLVNSSSNKSIAKLYEFYLRNLHDYSYECELQEVNPQDESYRHITRSVHTNYTNGDTTDMRDEELSSYKGWALVDDTLSRIDFLDFEHETMSSTDASRCVDVQLTIRLPLQATPKLSGGLGQNNQQQQQHLMLFDDDNDDYDYDDDYEVDDLDGDGGFYGFDDGNDYYYDQYGRRQLRRRRQLPRRQQRPRKKLKSSSQRVSSDNLDASNSRLLQYVELPIHRQTIKLLDYVLESGHECWTLWSETLWRALQTYRQKRLYPIKDSLYDLLMVPLNHDNPNTTTTYVSVPAQGGITKLGSLIDFVLSLRHLMRMTMICGCYGMLRQASERMNYTQKHDCCLPATSQGVYQEVFLTSKIGHELMCTSPLDTNKHCVKWLALFDRAGSMCWRDRDSDDNRRRQALRMHLVELSGSSGFTLDQYKK